MITISLFVIAAAAGALLRAEAGRRWNRLGGMPYGILSVNVAGSLLLGLMSNVGSPTITIVGVGALGTFATFSSFTRDVVALTQRGQVLSACLYLVLSLAAGVVAAVIGVLLVS